MRTAYLLVFSIVVTTVGQDSFVLLAQDELTDTVTAELMVRRDEYASAKTKAVEALASAFQTARDKVEANNTINVEVQLAQLEELDAERVAFIGKNILPQSKQMKTAVESYEENIRAADQHLLAAIADAIQKHRKGKNFEAVKELLEEQKDIKSSLGTQREPPKPTSRKNEETPITGREKLTKALSGKRITWDKPHTILLKPDGSGTYTKTGARVIWSPIDEKRLILLWIDSNDCDLLIFSLDKKSYDKRWLGNPGTRLDSLGEVLNR